MLKGQPPGGKLPFLLPAGNRVAVKKTPLSQVVQHGSSSSTGSSTMRPISSLISLMVLTLVGILPTAQAQTAEPQETGRAEEQASRANRSAPEQNRPADPLENLKFRNLGPAAGGGRVTAVAGVPGQPNVYYVGAAAGGVFRTNDGGLSWKPVFEREAVAAIRPIAVAPPNPHVAWGGTGEGNTRNAISRRRGAYVSTDGGGTWRFAGLKEAGQISSVVVDP